MNRRNFIKNSGRVLAGALLLPTMLPRFAEAAW